MDEATPHLHLDYIPVATGYKTGLKTRNSLTKALQNMGFSKGRGKKDNETIDWQKREREYLTGLCRERGIEIEVLGEDRHSLTLPEYKAAIYETEKLRTQNTELRQENETLSENNAELKEENIMIEEENQVAILEAQAILDEMENEQEDYQKKIDQSRLELKMRELEADTRTVVEKEVTALVGKAKSQAIPTTKGILDPEPYVKVPRKLWEKMLHAYKWGLEKSLITDKVTEQNILLIEKLKGLKALKKKMETFLGEHELMAQFQEFLNPKKNSITNRLNQKRTQNQEKKEQDTVKSDRRKLQQDTR